MMSIRLIALTLSALSAAAQGPLRLTDIQIIGTHNSYHSGLAPGVEKLLRKTRPEVADSLDYRHPSIESQLSSGVRQLEIDVYGDTKGGLFATPGMIAQVAAVGLPADEPYDVEGVMKKPGFKVLHVQDLDYRSNCQPFVQCLDIVRKWSKAHPGHLPIFIQIENKDSNPNPKTMVQPEKLTAATFDALDAEIRSVFGPGEMITPDDVRGKHKTLEEAVLTDGWPSLEKARGKVIFVFDQERVTPLYAAGHPSLEGRPVFTNATPGTPDAAFIKVNSALGPETNIAELVRKGYLIRTMTDPGRSGTNERRDAALKSGAQILSTDYPFDWRNPKTGFSVNFENGIARCNPVVQVRACSPDLLNEPR